MIKKAFLLCAVLVASLFTGVPAVAEPPPDNTFVLTLPATLDGDDEGFCVFPVRLDIVNHQRQKDTTLADGTVVSRFRGNATVTATNENTGESRTFKANGPGTQTLRPDGSYTIETAGPNLFFTPSGLNFPGVPEISYTTGNLKFSADSAGEIFSYSLRGSSTDVCEVLAP